MKQNKTIQTSLAGMIGILFAALVLAGCAKKPETVTEVSKAFWGAVITDDAGDVVEYSTLDSEEQYDRFGRDWKGMIPSPGQVVIDGDRARVNTQVAAPDTGDADMLYFVTFLVRTPDGWKVDYDKTARAVHASGAVVDFVDRITGLGQDIQRQFEHTSENIAIQMNAVVEQIDRMTEEYQDHAREAIDDTAASLQRLLDQLIASLNKAVEDLQGPEGEVQRKQLEESIDRLQSSSREMANPSLDAIANAGQQVIAVAGKLARLSKDKLQQYGEEWNRILDQFDAELTRFIDAYTASEDEARSQPH